ncbi:MAG: 4Fe-4S dicluster domain-containing protein [Candidatus Bathyarchaeota archaeon]|nr:4Fe-4S dicluster domain-containing protein [Candidatus Bathyarchaeota archaeon]
MRAHRSSFMLLTSPDRCRGCGLCELVCSISHGNGARPSASRIKVLKDREKHDFRLLVCLQCVNPKCVEACPKKAIWIDDGTGAKIIKEDACDGCGLCAEACPFKSEDNSVIFKHPSKRIYVKCDLCYQRKEGPICVEFCPSQALTLKGR